MLTGQGTAGLSCHTFSTVQLLIVNRFSSWFSILLLCTAAMSVLFSVPFSNEFLHFHSRHRYASLLFSMDSILPCTYSEFHLPVSPSQEVSFHLVYADNQPALSSTVLCLFSRCLMIVQHGKPQCILYVRTPKAPLQSDPRASSLCLSLASLHAPRFLQISL